MSLPFQSLSPQTPVFNEIEYRAFLQDGTIDPPVGEPLIALFQQDMTPISFEELLELDPGTYTFIIKNIGYGALTLGTITSDTIGFEITQPSDVSLQHNEQTTFTVLVPPEGGEEA